MFLKGDSNPKLFSFFVNLFHHIKENFIEPTTSIQPPVYYVLKNFHHPSLLPLPAYSNPPSTSPFCDALKSIFKKKEVHSLHEETYTHLAVYSSQWLNPLLAITLIRLGNTSKKQDCKVTALSLVLLVQTFDEVIDELGTTHTRNYYEAK